MTFHRTIRPLLFIIALVLFGCATTHPPNAPVDAEADKTVFTHDRFEMVLQRFGSKSGKIDYTALTKDPDDLNRYYQLVAAFNPDSHPKMFPTESHKLAYWINAYNAAAIKIVISYYPIGSVLEVKPPAVLFFLPKESGFFVFQKPVLGGSKVSLYHLENGIIRKRFADPRIHFALNCASVSCPRLPQRAFYGDSLDEQLEIETRRFVAEERNVTIDHQNQTIFLSQIFRWYEEDFIDWFKQNHPNKPASLTGYIALYLPAEKAAELKKVEMDYSLKFIPYDWRLNDTKNSRGQ